MAGVPEVRCPEEKQEADVPVPQDVKRSPVASVLGESEDAKQPELPEELRMDCEEVSGLWQFKKLLSPSWERIDREDLVAAIRERLTVDENRRLDDTRILRYLLGHDCDVDKIVKMLKDLAVWEQEIDIDQIREAAMKAGWAGLPNKEIVSTIVPMHPCLGETKDGFPFSVYRFGQMSISKAKKYNNPEDIQKIKFYSRHSNELGQSTLTDKTVASKRVVGFYQIFDLQGLGMKHLWNKGLLETMLKPVIEEASLWYPETSVGTFIVNAPLMFRAVWSLIKLWLDERQVYKCRVSGDVPQELFDIIGKENLPQCLNGDMPDPPCLLKQ